MKNYGASVLRWRQLMAAMRAIVITATTATALCAVPFVAAAAPAHAISDAQILAGPGDYYPVVGQINRGTSVDLNRCLPDYSWCDVSFGPNRGWVYGEQVTSAHLDDPNQ